MANGNLEEDNMAPLAVESVASNAAKTIRVLPISPYIRLAISARGVIVTAPA